MSETNDLLERQNALRSQIAQLDQRIHKAQDERARAAFTQIRQLVEAHAPSLKQTHVQELMRLLSNTISPHSSGERPRRGPVRPKYQLPDGSVTWTGRGRPPRAFSAWMQTDEYQAWKVNHPDEQFPAYEEA